MRRLIISAMLAGAIHAQQSLPRAWLASAAVLGAATAADAASSWGRTERNPMLGARFGGRSLTLKLTITGAGLAAQRQILSRAPHRARLAAGLNFAVAGLLTAAAWHNARR